MSIASVASRDVLPKWRIFPRLQAASPADLEVSLHTDSLPGEGFKFWRTRQVRVAFANPRRSYTHAFERYALELSRDMTIQDVAAHLGVGWDPTHNAPERLTEALNIERTAGDSLRPQGGAELDSCTHPLVPRGFWPRMASFGTECHAPSNSYNESTPGGIRTPNPRFRS